MKKALLIIDVQNDYFPNGNCELYKSDMALSVIENLLHHFRKQNLPIYFIQHVSTLPGNFFVPETNGVQIHNNIRPLDKETIIVKHHPNSFFQTNLHEKLLEDSVTDLVICGMMTHMCIDTTVRSAKDYGYSIELISDGCATKDLEWNGVKISAITIQNVFMASLNQKFASVVDSEDFLLQDNME